MLSQKTLDKFRQELDECQRPLYFFDDDPDGFCAFLLLYRYKREGRGIPVKSSSLNTKFINPIKHYEPDKIFVLDVPVIEQEFLEQMRERKMPVVWLDHHGPAEKEKSSLTRYFNPKNEDMKDTSSTTVNAYGATRNEKDLWIGMVGAVGDWQLPEYAEEFTKQHPELLPAGITQPEVALFKTPLGKLVKRISFMLKGSTTAVHKCIKIMTRIEHPDELMKETTARGKFLMNHAGRIEKQYDELFAQAHEAIKKTKEHVAVFTYEDDRTSFTKELSNEFIFLYPKKVIIIGRRRGDEMKMSMRTAKEDLPSLLPKAFEGIEGYGGGHLHACGACVKIRDFETFLKQFKEAVEKK
ncbi:MAG: DHH family phosphoesterase [Candidatus Woesearchaeota archaeon]|nr:DHH family phosphoesterase [Candidatus Woesearchaeota archaeon]